MSNRGIIAIALLLPAIAFERGAYYGMHSLFWLWSQREQMRTTADIATTSTVALWLGVLAAFAAGALAIAIGPRIVTAIGAAVSALGLFVLVGGSGAGFHIAAIGAGFFRTAIWACIAEIVLRDHERPGVALPGNRFATVAGLATLFYGAVNFAAMSSSVFMNQIGQRFGIGKAFVVAGLLEVAAALLAGGAVLSGGFGGVKTTGATDAGPYRAMPAPPTAPGQGDGQRIAIGLGILLLTICVTAGAEVDIPTGRGLGDSSRIIGLLYSINPAAIVGCTFFACAFWLAASMDRWSLAPITIAGIGIILLGVGTMFYLASSTVVLLGLGAFVTGVGEVLSAPILYAYVTLTVPRKYASLAVAAWIFGTSVVSAITRPLLAIEALHTALGALISIVLLAAGIGLAITGKTLHRRFFDPPSPAP